MTDKINKSKLQYYAVYKTKKHGLVKLLKYKMESEKKRKVCKVGEDALDYFFVKESELSIPENKDKPIKGSPAESQKIYRQKLFDRGYVAKTVHISKQNIIKLNSLKKDDETWNDFVNDLIQNCNIKKR